MRSSRDQLSAQGLNLVPGRDVDGFHKMLEARKVLQPFDADAVGALKRFGVEATENSTPHALFSQESLAPMLPEEMLDLTDQLAGYELHVVVTCRDLRGSTTAHAAGAARGGCPRAG